MRKGLLASWVAVVAALFAPAGAQAFCEGEGANPSELSVNEARATVVCLINEMRSNTGARQIGSDGRLDRAAQRHSKAMNASNFFSHSSPNGSSPLTRIRRSGYLAGASAWGIGENLRWGNGGHGSPRVAVNAWMQSPAHRSTMLDGRYREVGIGVAFGSPRGGAGRDSAIYTANFGYRK